MAGLNKAMLIGRLGVDPEIRYTSSGAPVATFRIATSETWTGKDGKKEERTEWHKIVAWGKLGELCGEYLNKGRRVFIEGRIQTRNWEDKTGNKRYTTEIVAQTVQFLDGPSKKGGQSREEGYQNGFPEAESSQVPPPDDEIPF